MKLLKLTIEGFGPYVNKQEIDFTVLGQRTLFLIHGNTGSGKSTILDAICFALYGETSGNERTGTQMRSNFAGSSTPTEVTFEFSVGGNCYRITRSPVHEGKKAPAAALWNTTETANHKLIANKKTQADEKIIELLGLNVETFRQVVVLPQGRFRELLMAPVKERQRILEVLFKTGEFRIIEEALKEASKDLKTKIEHALIKKKEILNESDSSSLDELGFKHYEYGLCISKKEAIVYELKDRAEGARNSLERVRRDNEKLQEQANAEAALRKLQSRSDELDLKQAKLIRARKALPLSEVEKSLSAGTEDSERAVKEHDVAVSELETAGIIKKTAAESLQAELARESERLKAQETLSLLTGLSVKVKELESTKAEITLFENTRKQLLEKIATAGVRYENLKKEITERQDEMLTVSVAASQKEHLERELKSLQQKHGWSIQSDELKKELIAAQSKLAQTREAFQSLQLRLKQEKEKLDELNGLWSEGQAAFLASTLVAGNPCPVCGSTEHPLPAAGAETIPTEVRLKTQKQAVEKLQQEKSMMLKEQADIESAIAVLSANIESIRGALLDFADKDIAAAVKETQERLRRATEAQAELEALRKATDNSEVERLQEELQRDDELLKAAIENESKARSKAEVIEKDVSEELRTETALLKAIEYAQGLVSELKKLMEKARADESAATADFAAKAESLKMKNENLQLSLQRKEQLQRLFQSKLKEAGFEDAVEFQNSKMTLPDIENLETEVSEFSASVSAASERLKRAQEAAAGLTPSELKTFEEAYNFATTEYDEQLKTLFELKNTHSNIGNYIQRLQKIEKEITALEKTYSTLGYIADVANGKNPYNLTFQRFVLASVLDDCLLVASKRLQLMSRGRYTLERSVSTKSGRTAGGLDLEVYDSYTGISRQVSTLSGGESFLASLSLALGLSDVVQSYAGGIHLETIFVDEGFGNLDPESLDLALKALIDLQEAGKLVGIISHVPDLKERIDARLEITFNGKGSTAHFVV
ncbi:MAG: AAA family ATPase [Nitrospirae bacterium YQR-1]